MPRVRMPLDGGHMDVSLAADASPETIAALQELGQAAVNRMAGGAGGATFKTWTSTRNPNGHNWHVHARHPVTKNWIASHGHSTEASAMLEGKLFCERLDDEWRRVRIGS